MLNCFQTTSQRKQATEATDFKRINYMIPARSDGTSWYSLRGEEVANEVTLIFRNDSLHCTSMTFYFCL